ISETADINFQVIATICAGILTGFVQPFIGYFFLKLTTKLDSPTAAAVAAHYGSISMVTFVTAVSFLGANNVVYAGYIIAVLALMEAPAILTGLFIAHRADPKTISAAEEATPKLSREILTNGAILLLTGAFLVGWATGTSGMEKMSGFLVDPFQGILALFLLDMGLLVSRQINHLKEFTFSLLLHGIYMPLIGATIGLALSALIGLDAGTGTLFTVLVASASYIAVTAAMRLALPQAKAAIYIPMSLAITFPFNILFGIPLYFAIAQKILS
ncbi:MAG: sodium-dependent bicarbonate transport family permease, partial [Pseudomonadota bacterium]